MECERVVVASCFITNRCVSKYRCFIVCTPQPPPIYALRDTFCRMANLIDVYMLTNRNCGYVKYATKESAENAIKVIFLCYIYALVLDFFFLSVKFIN